MRRCINCGIEKNESCFYENLNGCKECDNARRRKRYNKEKEHERYLKKKAKDPAKWKEQHRKQTERWRKRHPERALEKVRKYQKKRNKYYKPTEEEHARSLAYHRIWKTRNKEKVNAHRLVFIALRNGKMKKPLNCERCNKVTELLGHHKDYDKPYEVFWCCRECHGIIHRKKICH